QAGAARAADARRERERELFEGALLLLRSDLTGALADIEARRAVLAREESVVLPALDEHRRLTESALQQGQLDATALLLADELALKSRLDRAAAKLAWRRAWLQLDRAVGARGNR